MTALIITLFILSVIGIGYCINRIENDWNKIFDDEIKRRDKTFN
jgi:hypothetical protein